MTYPRRWQNSASNSLTEIITGCVFAVNGLTKDCLEFALSVRCQRNEPRARTKMIFIDDLTSPFGDWEWKSAYPDTLTTKERSEATTATEGRILIAAKVKK